MASSLRDTATGILETYVTWEDAEEKMQKALNTSAKFGPNKSVVHIGEGNGFVSRIALITCDWIDTKPEEELPAKFALKIASGLASKALDSEGSGVDSTEWLEEDVIRRIHNTEVIVYQFFNSVQDEVALPKYFYAVPFTEENTVAGSLALEFVDNSEIIHAYNNFTVDQVMQTAREIGKLNALSIVLGVGKIEELNKPNVLKEFWDKLNIQVMTHSVKSLKLFDKSEEMAMAVDAVVELVPEYAGTCLTGSIHTQCGFNPVLVNGDLWSANVMVDKDNGSIRALIDWQAAHHGVAVEDLLRFSFSALPSKERRDNAEAFIDELYTSMEDNLQGAKAPLSRKELHEAYDLLLPHCGFFFISLAAMLLQAMLAVHDVTEEEKQLRLAIVLEKMRGICEDIVVYHEKNKASPRKLQWQYVE